MKKLTFFFSVLLFLFFAACSSSDDAEKPPVDPNPPSEETYEKETINPDYVPIDWSQAKLTHCDPEKGLYSFSGSDASLKNGSVIIIDADTMQYIAVVKKATSSEGTTLVETVRGDLCDLFANTSFILSTSKMNQVRSGAKVYYPESISYTDDDGVRHTIPWAEATRADNSHRLTGHLWNGKLDLTDETLFRSDYCRIYLKEALFSIDIDLNLEFSFSARSKQDASSGIDRQYRSRALTFKGSIDGTFIANQRLQLDISGSGKYNKGYTLIKHRLFPPVTVTFNVGFAIIPVVLNSDFYGGCDIEAEGRISAYAGYKDKAVGSLGFDWEQGSGIHPIHTFTNDLQLTYPTVEGKGKITGQVYCFPRIRTLIYGLIGPSFDFRPYNKLVIEGGFHKELLSSSNDYCAWSLSDYIGMDLAVGISLSAFNFKNYEVGHDPLCEFNLFNTLLYRSPKDMRLVETESQKIEAGKNNSIRFEIYDMNHLTGSEILTPLPQIVKFDAPGLLKSKYGIAKKGIVSAEWTPQSSKDILTATLVTPDKVIVKEVECTSDIVGTWHCIWTTTPPNVKLLTMVIHADGEMTQIYYYSNKSENVTYTHPYLYDGHTLIMYKSNGDIQRWKVVTLTDNYLQIQSANGFQYSFSR